MTTLNRAKAMEQLRGSRSPFDILIIGGGATGLGIAIDAASRGFRTALIEQRDFASGTSSRSTKLVHGGVRYLQQGNVRLVREALRERGRLRRNAPHIVHDLPFIVPSYRWWESPFYGIGMKVYDLLAGRHNLQPSSHRSREDIIAAIPNIRTDGLRGGTQYFDGQFDDARLAIALAATAANHDAALCNYVSAIGLLKTNAGRVNGVNVRDEETGDSFDIPATVVINAGGPFADSVRKLDRADETPVLTLSQGTHIVLDQSFASSTTAIMVPRTPDGRVMFIIPWHNVLIVGTTDTPIEQATAEPRPMPEDIDLILTTANQYLSRHAAVHDIRSVFTGIRPLVRPGGAKRTAAISREHSIFIDPTSKLLTIVGGKWTTYREMAEDAMAQAISLGGFDQRQCITQDLPIHRFETPTSDPSQPRVHPNLALTESQIIAFCRNEMARTVDDVLSRRTRSIILDAKAALEAASNVARIMAGELQRDDAWQTQQVQQFQQICDAHLPPR